MEESLECIIAPNLRVALREANRLGISRKNFVNIMQMPDSTEVSIIYWKKHENGKQTV